MAREAGDATSVVRDHKNRDKQVEANLRQEKRDAKTPNQQLNELDARLGVGAGAKSERARLTKLINVGK